MFPEKFKKFAKIGSIILAVAIIGGLFFASGYYFGFRAKPSLEKIQAIENMETGRPEAVDFGLFWDTWHELEKSFIGRKNFDRQKMVHGAISGLVNSLGDPYTVFMPPDEARQFEEDVTGSFDGIGAEIGIRKGVLTIISPLKESPAETAGILAGDKILKIDDRITVDLTVDQAVRLIRGQKGTEVRLLLSRDSFEKAKEYKIIRQTIKIPVIKYEKKENGIFYIALYNFGQTSSGEFQKAVGEFLNSGSTKLILDLRNNPGGYLEAAVDIASWFLPKGSLVAKEDFGNGDGDEFKSYGYGVLENISMVVLTNEGSASASEILAGALRDIKGIKLIGKKTYGKGSVQELKEMKGGSSLKITVARWLTPSGISIMDEGLEPDVAVEMTEEDINAKKDPQLEKAIELVSSL